VDAFTRAKAYEKTWQNYQKADKQNAQKPRRDLELDALVQILNNKMHITCHSYVQSEVNMAMQVADKMGYKVNTFTHILEGYKVADKLKAHGAYASTFSDWWAYKMEVQDAIAYNAAIMHNVGLLVAINSDDAEMARRLNQEAGKIVKYGGVPEAEALKMVTLNPAKMLHVEDRIGSLKIGKDADMVLWSDNPLSNYAKALYTIVDGAIYFSREMDTAMRATMNAEKQRIMKKMTEAKGKGEELAKPSPTVFHSHSCLVDDINF